MDLIAGKWKLLIIWHLRKKDKAVRRTAEKDTARHPEDVDSAVERA